MSQVVWLPEALADAHRVFEFLKTKNFDAAIKVARLLKAGAMTLRRYPERGKPMFEDGGFRELFLPFGGSAYVLRYKLDQRKVVIVRVWHGKEFRA